jgi:hypothetical protein
MSEDSHSVPLHPRIGQSFAFIISHHKLSFSERKEYVSWKVCTLCLCLTTGLSVNANLLLVCKYHYLHWNDVEITDNLS